MGFDISQLDLDNIVAFAQRVVNLFAYRRNLQVRSAPECGINGTVARSMGHSMLYCPLTLPTAANCCSQPNPAAVLSNYAACGPVCHSALRITAVRAP
jgi:hypothetical protein